MLRLRVCANIPSHIRVFSPYLCFLRYFFFFFALFFNMTLKKVMCIYGEEEFHVLMSIDTYRSRSAIGVPRAIMCQDPALGWGLSGSEPVGQSISGV